MFLEHDHIVKSCWNPNSRTKIDLVIKFRYQSENKKNLSTKMNLIINVRRKNYILFKLIKIWTNIGIGPFTFYWILILMDLTMWWVGLIEFKTNYGFGII